MRVLSQVNGRQSIGTIVELICSLQAIQIRALALFIAFAIALSANASAQAQTPQKPRIINFRVDFDGVDQYYVSGQVVDVDNPEGLTVEFGDIIMGNTAQTQGGGYFGVLLFLRDAQYETFSAIVTSHEGVVSDRVSYWLE